MRHIIMMSLLLAFDILNAETIRLASGLSVEPYIIQKSKSRFEADIVRDVLKAEGYNVELIYQPLHRTKISFMKNKVDGVLTVKNYYPEVKGAFFSKEYIHYHNYAFSLKSKKIDLNKTSDLIGYSVIGFQQAYMTLGNQFRKMTEKNI